MSLHLDAVGWSLIGTFPGQIDPGLFTVASPKPKILNLNPYCSGSYFSKHMLCVLIRCVSSKRFQWVPQEMNSWGKREIHCGAAM